MRLSRLSILWGWLLCLLLFSAKVSAFDYVITYNENGVTYYVARQGTSGVERLSSFEPTTCIWTSATEMNATLGYSLSQSVDGTTYYLVADPADGISVRTLLLSSNSSVNYRAFRTPDASSQNNLAVCYTEDYDGGSNYYVYYDNAYKASKTQTDYSSKSVCQIYPVTATHHDEINTMTALINSSSTSINVVNNTISLWATLSGTYTAEYTTYNFAYNDHNYWNDADHLTAVPIIEGGMDREGNPCTYTWFINPESPGADYCSLINVDGTSAQLKYTQEVAETKIAEIGFSVVHPSFEEFEAIDGVNISLEGETTSILSETTEESSQNKYVILNSGGQYLSNNNGSISNPTVFNPSTCVWNGSNGGKWSNNGYYLYGQWSSISLNKNSSSNMTISSTQGGTMSWSSWRTYYLKYSGSAWTYGTSNGTACVYAITKIESTTEESTEPQINSVGVFSKLSSATVSHTNALYRQNYKNYIFKNNTNHYVGANNASISSIPAYSTFTYTWSLSDEAEGYVSVNASTGLITYSKYFAEDTQVTLTLTAYSPEKTYEVSTMLSFRGNRTNATSISASDITMEVGSSIMLSYSLAPADAYDYVRCVSSDPSKIVTNEDGSITSIGPGTATLTLNAYSWNRTTILVSTTINVVITNGNGQNPDAPYYISSQEDFEYLRTHPSYHYSVSSDIQLSSFSTITEVFTGTFDGKYKVISGLTSPLFSTVNDATIKNVVLDDVNITQDGNVGPLAKEANGSTRIYNCGVRATNMSSVSGSNYVGGLIGRINGNTRIINCYSFANVSGGVWAAGIVGYNPTATTTDNISSSGLIMNCMFYGNITSGTNISPIYGGSIISNAGSKGINNYNYYSLSSDITPTTYNCALAAEERYLTRFEFYRGILNSTRKLCAYYVKGNLNNTDEIGKWVLDRSIAKYPIIKEWGQYPSIINRNTEDATSRNPYEGRQLGTLRVTVNRGSNGSGETSTTITLPITDIDTLSYDYNYYKVQLPYYNDMFSGNYMSNKVVTGWMVTAITGGTPGIWTTTGDNAYNFADKNSTAKDLYSTSGVVFAQGGFFNVPEGVTAITITAKWANAVYLSDPYYDKVYSTSYSASNYTVLGSVPTKYNDQTIYTTLANAMSNVSTGATVYDAAIVLVGNYHSLSESWENGTKPFTIMSVDENMDNEPDYCIIHGHSSDRVVVNPIRFDFLWHPGLGMTSKVNGTTQMYNQCIFKPKGHFEITETALARYTEFEYDYSGKASNSPLILFGGIFEQFVSIFNDGTLANHTSYIKIGGNVFVKAFTPGAHPEQTTPTNHQPISVLGGEYPQFYLSGLRPDAKTTATNANCFTNGGRFHVFAGACQEQINGNVSIHMDHSLVDEFYGGGINAAKPITGNINVSINNSKVDFFCGGPKFGDMNVGKTVTTTAVGSTFNEFYGAGYGGTSLFSVVTSTSTDAAQYPSSYFNNFSDNRGSFDATNGIKTGYTLEYFDWAGGSTTSHVARFYVNSASLSLATVRNVSSVLTDCTIYGNYYGGGCLGTVNGTVTSSLNSCVVYGNVFGGGYSAKIPTCDVYPNTLPVFPYYNTNTGVFIDAVLPNPTKYKWSSLSTNANPLYTDENGNWIHTDVDLTTLGKVSGNTVINISGDSKIDGGVFGGGDESMVSGNTSVTISAERTNVINKVYGGGNVAEVSGNTKVDIVNGQIVDIFGGGNQAGVGGNTDVSISDGLIIGNTYGGGNFGDVLGTTKITIGIE